MLKNINVRTILQLFSLFTNLRTTWLKIKKFPKNIETNGKLSADLCTTISIKNFFFKKSPGSNVQTRIVAK